MAARSAHESLTGDCARRLLGAGWLVASGIVLVQSGVLIKTHSRQPDPAGQGSGSEGRGSLAMRPLPAQSSCRWEVDRAVGRRLVPKAAAAPSGCRPRAWEGGGQMASSAAKLKSGFMDSALCVWGQTSGHVCWSAYPLWVAQQERLAARCPWVAVAAAMALDDAETTGMHTESQRRG
jgi:hypothetical protein